MRFAFDKHLICETTRFGGYIAVKPRLHDDGLIGFFCLSHHRLSEPARVLVDHEEFLEWEDDADCRMFLRPLTLERYRAFLRHHMGTPDYQTEEALRAAIKDAMRLVH